MAANDILLRSKKKKARARMEANDLEGARRIYADLCRTYRNDAELWFLRGVLEGRLGNLTGAVDYCRQALAIAPRHVGAHYNLGIALRDLGQTDDAIAALTSTIALAPDHPGAPGALAMLLMGRRDLDAAAEVLRSGLQHHPAVAEWHTLLGAVYQLMARLEDAAECYRTSISLEPRSVVARDNLGIVRCGQGLPKEALRWHEEARARAPADHRIHSNMLMSMQYLQDIGSQELLEAHRRWGAAHGGRNVAGQWSNVRDPERPLKVGYVSPDMRTHSVAYFLEPLLANHDPAAVVSVCYSDVPQGDATTQRLRALAVHWRDTAGLTDQQLADRIRADQIDILVDLAGHTSKNRLKVFTFKPAPLQVTYLGYPDTTGLDTVDYRITDATADPAGAEAFHTESLLRLDGCFLCYRPAADSPPVSALPMGAAGGVTFGSFNNMAKLSPAVLELWVRVVDAVPGARLLIKNPSLADTATRERCYQWFAQQGVGADRVELLGPTAGRSEHLALYSMVDIALDTFPYAGTTTTCEALWMGVPVVTLAGARHAGRVGASLLAAVGHPEWVAASPEEYLALATELAADPQRLGEIRAQLRGQMRASALCDEHAFARVLEQAYRDIWHRWCGS